MSKKFFTMVFFKKDPRKEKQKTCHRKIKELCQNDFTAQKCAIGAIFRI